MVLCWVRDDVLWDIGYGYWCSKELVDDLFLLLVDSVDVGGVCCVGIGGCGLVVSDWVGVV